MNYYLKYSLLSALMLSGTTYTMELPIDLIFSLILPLLEESQTPPESPSCAHQKTSPKKEEKQVEQDQKKALPNDLCNFAPRDLKQMATIESKNNTLDTVVPKEK